MRRQPNPDKPTSARAERGAAAAVARGTSALAHAGEGWQRSMLSRGGQLQREAAHQLRLATNPAELVAVQAAWMMASWQHSVQCTADLANAWFAVGAAGALPKRADPKAH